ncbi:MAG: polymer-forming cytoskeletal protein [Alphaproteobacteria bacterium]
MSSKPPQTPSGAPSIIAGDVELKGNLQTTGEVQFDGKIDGDLNCGSLIIGKNATVKGGVTADTVVVHGQLSGTIRAKKVRLESSARVSGDVFHEEISIESGAHIEGQFARVDNARAASSPSAKPAAAASDPAPSAPKAAAAG